ncbi:Serine/threonine-protein kinase PknD [Stieleria maiorica]|uniref:Serine/threonine-protein kinase PknD n=1 Tax=Stieleria maiorica TaxID=2795974 RepID=A0A5B9MIT5_9BACT|nr:protein kinase [Stieleria maiorica]QEF99880.1 Serine/threonine-protein kinase PknD [Stieleria maiorica]
MTDHFENDDENEPDEENGPEDTRPDSDHGGGPDPNEETVQWSESPGQSTVDIPPTPGQSTRIFAGGQRGRSADSDATTDTLDAESIHATRVDNHDSGSDSRPIDATIDAIDVTVPMDAPDIRLPPDERDDQDTLDPADAPDPAPPSVMQSRDISQTINPRELSKEDAAFWGSAAIDASKANRSQPTKLRPAVERSIHESKLHIRERDLAIPTRDPDAPSDYRLIRLLGRGGMGNVYVARQSSLDRMIAVKVIKPLPKDKRQSLRQSGRLEAVERERRQQFLSEAVVTGDLDHPNIVPIHDIAVAADNTLFYAMKRVVGKPWLKTIHEKTRDENLEILLKVCDAIAFAHTRGVIHRDIKPENIMLGDFGEVLVMDWGLAIAQPEFEKKQTITFSAGLGGTPAFMSPEMALGPVDAIGPHSDIYLLGATLYYIVTGHAPHQAENVTQCIRKVAVNEIQEVSPQHRGELMDIALRAMATEPKDRYPSVQEFQQAIRSYRSHSESIAISTAAEREHQRAVETSRYESFSRSAHGFEQALELWDGNQAAAEGLARCRIDHATAAYDNGDYDLGLSLLDASNSDHLDLIEKLNEGLRQRELRSVRLHLFRRLVAASVLFILVGGSIALYVINDKRNEANEQREIAETALKVAKEQTQIAKAQRDRAIASEELAADRLTEVEKKKAEVERQKGIAEENERLAIKARADAETNEQKAKDQKKIADQNAADALRQQQRAETSEQAALVSLQRARYESYLSQIGLAKARIDGNEFDDARLILKAIRQAAPDDPPTWEWRYLWQLANQSRDEVRFGAGVVDLAVTSNRRSAVVVCNDASVHRSNLDPGYGPTWIRKDLDATCTDIADDERWIAVGTKSGAVLVINPLTGQTLRRLDGHDATVTDVTFLPDGRLVTASSDRTISLWDLNRPQRLAQGWHLAPVVALAAHQSNAGDPPTIVAAVSDGKISRVVAWRIETDRFGRIGEFSEHPFPVASLALSADGQLAASGDTRGNVYLWRPQQLRPTDFDAAIKKAITSIGDASDSPSQSNEVRNESDAFVANWTAHPDAVGVIRFDDADETLLTGSDDYTIRAWNLADQSLRYTLRGHGGWVRGLDITLDESGGGAIVSGSVDQTVRLWDRPARESLAQEQDESADGTAKYETRLHQDEILAARLDPSGSRLISASRDHTARILGVDRTTMTFREISRFNIKERLPGELNEGTEFLAMSARLDTAGKRLFVGSADATIRIWDVGSGTQLGSLAGTGINNAFALSRDGRRLLSGSSRPDAKALLWDVDPSSGVPKILHRLPAGEQAVTAFAISATGEIAITGDRGGRLIVWDTTTGQPLGQPVDLLRGHRINELAISPDDSSLWVASDNGQLVEIDLSSRQPRRRLDHDGFVTSVSLSPRGDQAVTLSAQTTRDRFVTTATWWDLATEQSRRLDQVQAELDENGQTSGDHPHLTSARFGDRGSDVVICRQAGGGRGGRVTMVDLAGEQTKSFDLPAAIGAPESGLLSGDDHLITLNGEAAFRWSIRAMEHQKSYRPHASVVDACFTPDGKFAATASRSVRLWKTDTGAAIDKLENPHPGAITGMDIASRMDERGYRIITSGAGAEARLWRWKDPETGFDLERVFGIEGTEVAHVRFAPDGETLLLAGADGSIRAQPLDGAAATFGWRLPAGLAPTCIACSNDGRYIAVGASDKTAWLIDMSAGESVKPRVMRGHADRIESISVVSDGSSPIRVLTASRDKSARVWDPRLSVQQDDLSAASDVIFGREVLALRRHTQGVTAIDRSADGNLVITAARDGNVLLWPAPDARPIDNDAQP